MTAFRMTPLKYLVADRITNGVGLPAEHENTNWPRYIRTTDIAGPRTLRTDVWYSQPPELLKAAGVLEGDLLLTNAGTVGKAYLHTSDDPAVCAGYLTRIRPDPSKVDSRYLAYYCESQPFWDQINVGATRSTIDNFSSGKYQDLLVPIPPLDTQRRIADMLDAETARIDTLIEKNERVLGLLERRRLSVVVAAVCGDRSGASSSGHESAFWLGSMPREWVVAGLGYRYDVQLGKMLSAERRESGDQRPYLANVDVQWDRINVDGLRTMDLSDEEWPRYGVEPGDVLICEGGDIGRSAVWPIDGPSGIHFQKALHRARPLDPAQDNPRWLYYAMLAAAKSGVFQFGAEASTIDHLTGERLREHRFPFPPRDEQDRLVEDLDRALAKIDSLRVKVDRQQELLRLRRQALITAAVTGQIEI